MQPTNEKTDTKKIVEAIAKDVNNVKKETEITTDKLKKTSLERSLSQRPKPVDVKIKKEKNDIRRSANVVPHISDHVSNVRKKTDNVKRPSRNR